MKVYKNGICREIDSKREQEFREKGYVVEGKETTDIVEVIRQENEVLKQENKALKAENEVLKQENEMLKVENEALKAHTGGEENATTDTTGENGETTEAKTTTRGRK